MAIYPRAIRKLLPENETQQRIHPRTVILHTAVDSPAATSLFPYFMRAEVKVESHFFVRWDGTVEQYIDTEVMANANVTADRFAVSIETEDDGTPEANPWAPAQLDAIIALCDWICAVHAIPRVLVETPTSPGLGWHAMWSFDDPVAQTGRKRSPWTLYLGKTCPGKPRIHQFLEVVLPALTGMERLPPHQENELMLFVEAVNSPTHPVNPCFVVVGDCWHHIASEEAYAWYNLHFGERKEWVRFQDLNKLKRIEGLAL